MTSGSIAKARTYLRTSYVQIGGLLFLVFGLTILLATRLQTPALQVAFQSTPLKESGSSWKDTILQRVADWIQEDDEWENFQIHDPSYYEEDSSAADGPTQQEVLMRHPRPLQHWCSEAEYLDGLWVKRSEPVTPENIRKIFKVTNEVNPRCPPIAAVPGQEYADDDPASWSRIWETAQYEWKPRSGCRKHEFDRWNFAKYCLRAKAGCSIVGDSLADQLYAAIRDSMIMPGLSLFELHGGPELIFNVTVNRYHPLAARLASDAGVQLERFDRPLLNYWREHHLLNRPELDQVFHDGIGYKLWTGGPPYAQNGWIWDRSWWYELWTQELERPNPLVGTKDRWKPMEERSVISFSSGPHWTTTELWPRDGWVTRNFDELLLGWTRMFDIVSSKVDEAVGEGHNVLAWWRSSVPGHFDCWQYTAPENDRTHPFSTLDPTADAFNWKLYPLMDEHASNRTDYVPSNTSQQSSRRQGMRFMDLWTMSVKRPDAHLRPQSDCTHSCSPGLGNEWLEYMFHLMVNEAENADYDEPPPE